MAQPKVIFDCDEIIRACTDAKAANRPLSTLFTISAKFHPNDKGSLYFPLIATIPGKTGRLLLRVVEEVHRGQIAPFDENELVCLNAERRGTKFGEMKARSYRNCANLSVQKYPTFIETDDVGSPTESLPEDDKISKFFKVVEFVNEFFMDTIDKRIDKKEIVDSRRENPPAGAIVARSTRVASMIQTHVANPRKKLVNPIMRVKVKFEDDTGSPKGFAFYDYSKPYINSAGRTEYEELTIDGQKITADNIHMIKSRTMFSGVINMNAVCFSAMGISIPMTVMAIIMQLPVTHSIGVGDIFGESGAAAPPAPIVSGPKVEDRTAAPAADIEAMQDGDLEDVLDVLSIED